MKLLDQQHFTLSIGRRVLNSQLLPNGTIPVYSANVFSPFGKIDSSVIADFSVPSVIWGIDGDWMVNYIPANIPFCPTDHCGVLRVVSADFNPHFVKFFVDQEGAKAGFSRSYRASLDRISTLSIPRVPINIQNSIIERIESIQNQISNLEETLPALLSKQVEIVNRYII